MHSQRFWQVTTESCWGGSLSPEAILPAICPSFPTVAFDTQLLLLPQLRPSFCVLSPCWTQGSSFFSQTLHSHEPIPFNWILGEMGAEGSTKKNKLKLNLHFELHWPHSLLGKFLPPLVDFRYLQMDEYISSVYLGFPPHPLKMFTYLDALGLCWITWDVLLRQAYLVASWGTWDVTSSPEIVPASPALAGGFLNTGPTGRFLPPHLFINFFSNILQNPSPSYH